MHYASGECLHDFLNQTLDFHLNVVFLEMLDNVKKKNNNYILKTKSQ